MQKGRAIFPLEGKAEMVFSQFHSQLSLLSWPSEHVCWREGEGRINPTWEDGVHHPFSSSMRLHQLKVQMDPDPGSTNFPLEAEVCQVCSALNC